MQPVEKRRASHREPQHLPAALAQHTMPVPESQNRDHSVPGFSTGGKGGFMLTETTAVPL